MIIGPYAFPLEWADIQIAELDVRGEIEDGQVVEVQVVDLRSGQWSTIGGTLEEQIARWIRLNCTEQISEADQAERIGRKIYAREIARQL